MAKRRKAPRMDAEDVKIARERAEALAEPLDDPTAWNCTGCYAWTPGAVLDATGGYCRQCRPETPDDP